MNNGNQHIISKVSWDAQIDNRKNAQALQNALSSWTRMHLPAQAEAILSKLCPEVENWRIQELELDLGQIEFSKLESTLFLRFGEVLENTLRDLILHPQKSKGILDVLSSEQSKMEMIEFFLQNGYLPWWKKNNESGFSPVYKEELRKNPTDLARMLRGKGKKASVRKRLVWQLDDEQVRKTIHVLEPYHGQEICAFVDYTIKVQTEEKFADTSMAKFRRDLWIWVFVHLFEERGTIYNTAAFMRLTISKMAMEYKLDYKKLLSYLYNSLKDSEALQSHSPDFLKALTIIVNEQIPSSETRNLKATAFSSDLKEEQDGYEQLRKLVSKTGKKESGSVNSPYVLDELIAWLLQENPSQFAQKFRQVYTENALKASGQLASLKRETQVRILEAFFDSSTDERFTLFLLNQLSEKHKETGWAAVLDHVVKNKNAVKPLEMVDVVLKEVCEVHQLKMEQVAFSLYYNFNVYSAQNSKGTKVLDPKTLGQKNALEFDQLRSLLKPFVTLKEESLEVNLISRSTSNLGIGYLKDWIKAQPNHPTSLLKELRKLKKQQVDKLTKAEANLIIERLDLQLVSQKLYEFIQLNRPVFRRNTDEISWKTTMINYVLTGGETQPWQGEMKAKWITTLLRDEMIPEVVSNKMLFATINWNQDVDFREAQSVVFKEFESKLNRVRPVAGLTINENPFQRLVQIWKESNEKQASQLIQWIRHYKLYTNIEKESESLIKQVSNKLIPQSFEIYQMLKNDMKLFHPIENITSPKPISKSKSASTVAISSEIQEALLKIYWTLLFSIEMHKGDVTQFKTLLVQAIERSYRINTWLKVEENSLNSEEEEETATTVTQNMRSEGVERAVKQANQTASTIDQWYGADWLDESIFWKQFKKQKEGTEIEFKGKTIDVHQLVAQMFVDVPTILLEKVSHKSKEDKRAFLDDVFLVELTKKGRFDSVLKAQLVNGRLKLGAAVKASLIQMIQLYTLTKKSVTVQRLFGANTDQGMEQFFWKSALHTILQLGQLEEGLTMLIGHLVEKVLKPNKEQQATWLNTLNSVEKGELRQVQLQLETFLIRYKSTNVSENLKITQLLETIKKNMEPPSIAGQKRKKSSSTSTIEIRKIDVNKKSKKRQSETPNPLDLQEKTADSGISNSNVNENMSADISEAMKDTTEFDLTSEYQSIDTENVQVIREDEDRKSTGVSPLEEASMLPDSAYVFYFENGTWPDLVADWKEVKSGKALQIAMKEQPSKMKELLSSMKLSSDLENRLMSELSFGDWVDFLQTVGHISPAIKENLTSLFRAIALVQWNGVSDRALQRWLYVRTIQAFVSGRSMFYKNMLNEFLWELCTVRQMDSQEATQAFLTMKSTLSSELIRSLDTILVAKKKSKFQHSSIPFDQGKKPQAIPVTNAGLVLVQVYFERLFNMFEMLGAKNFVDEDARKKAVHVLQYLSSKRTNVGEEHLVLNKVLCGMDPSEPIEIDTAITEKEQETIEGLIKAMINYWSAIGDCSVDGFRGNWLIRDGLLTETDERWEMTVEKRPYDLLIDRSPFSFSIIKLPWMNKPLHVQWPY